jgi:hypothetical protein
MSRPRPSVIPRIDAAFALALLCFLAASAGAPAPLRAETIARLAAPDAAGEAAPPGPFALLPDGKRVAVQVPASAGILVLEGARVVAHLPLPHGLAVDDLDAKGDLLVSGAALSGGHLTIQIGVFDVARSELVIRVDSANPFLRMHPDSSRGWRAVAGNDRAGVFHPPTAASYPLWDREIGIVPSSEQMGRAHAGIGFEERDRWVPEPDGSVGRRHGGPTAVVLEAGHGTFVGGLDDDTLLMRRDGSDAAADATLPEVIVLDAYRGGEAIGSVRLRARAHHVPAERALFHGRPVRVTGGRVVWAYAGDEGLEIRAIEPRFTSPGSD